LAVVHNQNTRFACAFRSGRWPVTDVAGCWVSGTDSRLRRTASRRPRGRRTWIRSHRSRSFGPLCEFIVLAVRIEEQPAAKVARFAKEFDDIIAKHLRHLYVYQHELEGVFAQRVIQLGQIEAAETR